MAPLNFTKVLPEIDKERTLSISGATHAHPQDVFNNKTGGSLEQKIWLGACILNLEGIWLTASENKLKITIVDGRWTDDG